MLKNMVTVRTKATAFPNPPVAVSFSKYYPVTDNTNSLYLGFSSFDLESHGLMMGR